MAKQKYQPGDRIGRLTVQEFLGNTKYRCVCDCGKETIAWCSTLTNGEKKSCGCMIFEPEHWQAAVEACTTHGHSSPQSPTYRSWSAMRTRCHNSNQNSYKNYGAKGIKVCEGWERFENFLADVGVRPDDHTLSRIDHQRHYSCGHCKQCKRNRWPRNAEWAPANSHGHKKDKKSHESSRT